MLPRFFSSRSVCSLGISMASLSISSCALSNTGAERANSGKTTSRTGRNGAAPAIRRIDHRQHAIRVRAHLFALDWIRQVRLATSD
jgi:hypothetical protein